MKIVLDANVYISAFFWRGPPKAVFDRVTKNLDSLFITNDIINEIAGVIKRPKFDGKEKYKASLTAGIRNYGKIVTVPRARRVSGACRDPKDDMYLECALAAHADYVVTGDNDLLVMAEYGGVKMVSPSAYLALCGPDTR